jgi:hypothetical protein
VSRAVVTMLLPPADNVPAAVSSPLLWVCVPVHGAVLPAVSAWVALLPSGETSVEALPNPSAGFPESGPIVVQTRYWPPCFT